MKSKSFVISVSYATGVYRHIKISSEATLYHLHEAILDSIEFLDDHAHVFFMDNKEWSDKASYYAEVIEDEENYTSEVTLDEVLKPDMKFKYVFDFGENWSFQCKVLKELKDECSEYSIIRTVGEAPEQYGYYEEDEE